MKRLEVSGAVRPICGSLGVKRLNEMKWKEKEFSSFTCQSSNTHFMRDFRPTFRVNLSVPSSRVKKSNILLELLYPLRLDQ